MAYKIPNSHSENKSRELKSGQLYRQKIIVGKDGTHYAIKLYYFNDGYRIYAWKEIGKNKIIESRATDYPIKSQKEAIKELNSYKDEGDILLVHSALRKK